MQWTLNFYCDISKKNSYVEEHIFKMRTTGLSNLRTIQNFMTIDQNLVEIKVQNWNLTSGCKSDNGQNRTFSFNFGRKTSQAKSIFILRTHQYRYKKNAIK